MAQKAGEADLDQPHYGWARGGNFRNRPVRVLRPATQVTGEQLGAGGRLVHAVKAQLQQTGQHQVGVVQVVELAIEGGVRDGYGVLVVLQGVEAVGH